MLILISFLIFFFKITSFYYIKYIYSIKNINKNLMEEGLDLLRNVGKRLINYLNKKLKLTHWSPCYAD